MTYPMFDPLIDSVMVIGPDRQIFYCNEACVNLFSLPRRKMTSGAPCYEFISFSDEDLFLMPNGQKGLSEPTSYREVSFQSASGKTGLVQVTIHPTSEMFGRTRLWFVYFHDVTLEAELHKKYKNQLDERRGFEESIYRSQNEILEKLSESAAKAKGFVLQKSVDPTLALYVQEIESYVENLKEQNLRLKTS